MYPDFDELLLLLIHHSGNCFCREHLTPSKKQPSPAKPPRLFLQRRSSTRQVCGSHRQTDAALRQVWQRSQHCLSLRKSLFFPPGEGETQGDGCPSSSHCFCTSAVALLSSTKSPSFSCSEYGEAQHFLFHL